MKIEERTSEYLEQFKLSFNEKVATAEEALDKFAAWVENNNLEQGEAVLKNIYSQLKPDEISMAEDSGVDESGDESDELEDGPEHDIEQKIAEYALQFMEEKSVKKIDAEFEWFKEWLQETHPNEATEVTDFLNSIIQEVEHHKSQENDAEEDEGMGSIEYQTFMNHEEDYDADGELDISYRTEFDDDVEQEVDEIVSEDNDNSERLFGENNNFRYSLQNGEECYETINELEEEEVEPPQVECRDTKQEVCDFLNKELGDVNGTIGRDIYKDDQENEEDIWNAVIQIGERVVREEALLKDNAGAPKEEESSLNCMGDVTSDNDCGV